MNYKNEYKKNIKKYGITGIKDVCLCFRAGLLQSVRSAAHWEGTLPHPLPEQA